MNIRLLCAGCFALFALVCMAGFLGTLVEEQAADTLYTQLTFQQEESQLEAEQTPAGNSEQSPAEWFDSLREQMPDLVAWISGPGLDYPVVQGADNAYYLNHLADGTPNPTGAIFLDAGAPSDFSGEICCLYGHALARGTMFSGLERYREPAFCEEHPTLSLETPEGTGTLTVVGVCLRDGQDPYPTDFSSQEERAAFLTWVAEHSLVALTPPSRDGPLVILSTCAYDFEDARLAVVTQLEWKERN